ncbi:hypothetical protein ES708_31922 [subsurface metagenome]
MLGCIKFPCFFTCTTGKLTDKVFVGITQHITFRIIQSEVDLIQVCQNFYDQFVFIAFRFTQLTTGKVQVFEQVPKILFALCAEGALFNIGEHFVKVTQDKLAFTTTITPACQLAEQLGGL